MAAESTSVVEPVIGRIPYRIALAGGWIDQPFVSQHDPAPPGSMVVAALEPNVWYMERSGMATGTRKVATSLWHGQLPQRPPAELVKELYAEENRDKAEPSGSQDMIGLIYPGINRLDFRIDHAGGVFPAHIESCNDPETCRWLESVLHLVPIAPRPEGYNPLGVKNLDPAWVQRLGQTGGDCYAAILDRDTAALGRSMNECMLCWQTLLPHTVQHPTISIDLLGLLHRYQGRYAGAMYSGCGGGYLCIASDESVPGALQGTVRFLQEGV